MTCTFPSHQLPEFIVTLVTNCSGVLFTVFSIICVITNVSIDPSLCGILLSFSIANLLGIVMLTYDTIALICYHGEQRLGFVATISVTLSTSHLMLLILAEYVIITSSSSRRSVKDFTGLIIISWIISVTLGSVNVVTLRKDARVIFAVGFILVVFFIFTCYLVIVRRHIRAKRILEAYKKHFLKVSFRRNKVVKTYWNLKYFAIIICSYVSCSIPWVVNEFREGLEITPSSPMFHSISLVIYSLNFYFPSAICMYLRYKQWMAKKSSTPAALRTSFRYRDT